MHPIVSCQWETALHRAVHPAPSEVTEGASPTHGVSLVIAASVKI